MPRRARVRCRTQFLTQNRTQGGFQPIGDRQGINHRRPTLAILHRQHFRQRLCLCRQSRSDRISRGLPVPRRCQRRRGRRARLFRQLNSDPSRRQPGIRLGRIRRRPRDHCRIDLLRRDPLPFLADGPELLVQPVRPLLGLRQKLSSRLRPGIRLRRRLGCAIGLGFRHPDRIGQRDNRRRRCCRPVVMPRIGLGQRGFLAHEPLIRCRRIALQLPGMGQILTELPDPPLCLTQGNPGLLFLAGDLLLRHTMAFQHRASIGLDLAQRGQGGRRLRRKGRRRSGRIGRRRYGDRRRMQRRRRLIADQRHPCALQRQQLRLGVPDRAGNVAVPAGLPSLAFQIAKLAVKLGAQIFGAAEIGLRRPQFQLRLMPAGVQPGDVGGLFQQCPAVLRFGADQRANPPLADHRRSPRPRRQIREQRLNIPRPGFLAINLVCRSAAAFDPPDDFQFRLLMKRRRSAALGLVQEQGDFGDVPRRPSGGAGEDDVLHLAAAQVAGTAFAHRPAQGFHDIGLAAAVRSDDASQSGQDFHARGFGEALEPGDANAAKTDRQ